MNRSAKKKKQTKTAAEFTVKPDFSIHWQGYEAIRPELLETFDYEYRGKDTEVIIETDEFTSVCPWSGLPDFATIRVEYVPVQKIIELRSFKYYLYTYRQVGIFQEHLTQRLLRDLVECCSPKRMTVVTDYNIRGGIHTVCCATYQRKNKS